MFTYLYLDSSSLSSGAAAAIGSVVTLLVSVIVTAIVTFAIAYILMKRKDESTPQDKTLPVYEQVHSPNLIVTKNDPECQKNPAYDVGKMYVVMDTDPAYEIYN